jgi:hypothetical protein
MRKSQQIKAISLFAAFRYMAFLLAFSAFDLQASDHDEDRLASWEALVPDEGDPPINWIDNSHSYLTNRTQSLAGWMDAFFGDPAHDADKAESFIRITMIDDWNSKEGNQSRIKIRGRVQLPRLSRRLSLVFNGEDRDFTENRFDPEGDDTIGVQFRASESSKSSFDYTLGYSSDHLRPGIRYRREAPIGNNTSYRLTERIQYEHGENFFSRTQFRLSRHINDDQLLSWASRLTYGESTSGVEWSSNMSFQNRYHADKPRPIAVSYFTSVGGNSRPEAYTSNYNFGVLFRRQVYRDFLFLELEPSLDFRKLGANADRVDLWRFIARLEIALHKDKVRSR